MIKRSLNILKSSSFFLFGARGTGKTTLMTDFFQGEQVFGVDLLEGQLYSDYLSRPGLLGERLNALPDGIRWVFIDEIQKIPALLDEVHRLLFAERFRFALTGSSARKLKRGGPTCWRVARSSITSSP